MKKFSKVFALFIFLLVLMLGCTSESKYSLDKTDSSRPANTITYQEMAVMFHQYDIGQKKVLDAYRAKFTNNPKDSIESVSHFYELADLKQYIAYLERISKEKEIPLTGIRIFTSAYPKDYSNKELRGRQTLIFMPTAKIGNQQGVAFEPLYSNIGEPIKFTEFLDKYSSKETKQVVRASFLSTPSLQNGLNSSGANRLDPSPPM